MLEPNFFGRAVENSQRTFHSEARLSGVARIEKRNRSDAFEKWLVRVAKHDDLRLLTLDFPGQRVFQRMRIHDVMQQKFAASQRYSFCEAIRQLRLISVASHR